MIDGKGMWIWNLNRCEGGDPARIVEVAQAAGLTHVLLKIADGSYSFNGDVRPLVSALQAAGIVVWGWQYVYGHNPEREALIAVQRTRETGCTGFIVDAEGEFKQIANREKIARAYMAGLRAGLGNSFPLGLSTYRYPRLHQEFPFVAFLERCNLAMPQVYWLDAHNAAQQLQETVKQYREITSLPVVPTGAAWEQGKWQATEKDVAEFLTKAQNLGLSGCNFWSWEHARRLPRVWETIASYPWDDDRPTPEPTPTPARVRVTTSALNVRSAPIVSAETKRFVARYGQTFDVERAEGDWMQVKLWMHRDYLEEI